MPLSAEVVRNIGQSLEGLSQGLYISAFYRCIIVLLEERRRRLIPYYPLLGTSLSLFVVGTLHFIAGAYQNTREVTDGPASTRGIAIHLRGLSFIVSTALANGFMVYRCLVIWNNYRRIILLPSVLYLASFGLSVWLAITCIKENTPLFHISMIPRLFCFVTFGLNLLLSGLIIYRIWGIQRELAKVVRNENRFIRRATALGIESGVLSSVLFLALIVTSYTSRSAMDVIYSCVVPLLGMVVSAIILRIGKGISHGDPATCIPVEFRNSTFSNTAKGSYPPTSLPTYDSDDQLAISRRDRGGFDLTN